MIHNTIEIIAKSSPHLSWIKERCIYLVRAGSHSYGTNIEGSDEDFKGLTIPPIEYFFGFNKKFEQAILKAPDPDTTIFGIQKFFALATVANPNVLEMLYVSPEDQLYISPLMEPILENRDLFLTKRIKHTTCGYAHHQFHRIKQHRRWILNPMKEPPTRKGLGLPEQELVPKAQYEAASAAIKKELEEYNFDFLDDCPEPTKIAIKNAWQDMLTELKITTSDQWLSAARKIGLNDNFIEIMQLERQWKNAKEEWQNFLKWKKNRNPARYALEEKFGMDTKHSMHLYRLLTMAREVLTTGKFIVKRPDKDKLIGIRNGDMSFEELEEFANREEIELQELHNKTTILPKLPDLKKLDEICIPVIERSFN